MPYDTPTTTRAKSMRGERCDNRWSAVADYEDMSTYFERKEHPAIPTLSLDEAGDCTGTGKSRTLLDVILESSEDPENIEYGDEICFDLCGDSPSDFIETTPD